MFGTASEKAKPDELADILFLAVLVAALVSVGLQLCQWLALSEHDAVAAWVLPLPGSRPYANLMQPNQLATLQLWGLLACGWWVARGKLSRFGAAMLALVLMDHALLHRAQCGDVRLATPPVPAQAPTSTPGSTGA